MPRHTLRRTLALFALVALLPLASVPNQAHAQRRKPRAPVAADQTRAAAAPDVAPPTPQSVLGFNPGDDKTIADWSQITGYFARLDAASDRVKVRQIGETTLGRPMIVAFISAPENIRDLAKYKEIQRRGSASRL